MTDFKSAIRKQGETAQITVVGVEDLITAVGADSFRMTADLKGNEFLHVLNSLNGDYFSIGVSPKAPLFKSGEERIVEALGNYVIYTGTSDNGVWFTLSREPRPNEPVAKASVKDIMAAIKKTNGQPAKVG